MSEPAIPKDQSGFWSRQFAPQPTRGQFVFDIVFGIVLPLICVRYDPIVFQTSFGESILGRYAIPAYAAIALGLISLSIRFVGMRASSFVAGTLFASAVFATILGVILLPMSLIGLMFLIGILGLVPFATAFVCFRNARRSLNAASQRHSRALIVVSFACGLLLACAAPCYMQYELSNAINLVQSSDAVESAQGVAILKRYQILARYDGLVYAYRAERDSVRRERIAAAYRELTGESIDQRVSVLID